MAAGFERLEIAEYRLPDDFTARLLSPSLIVYLDHVRENLRRVLELADGDPDRFRPHVKTSKIPAVFAELLRAGLRSFKCSTTREADELARVIEGEGIDGTDILLAYPLVGPGIERLGQVARSHPDITFSVLAEDAATVADVPAELSIFVDINPGMNRTGVPQKDEAAIAAVASAAGDRFRGLHYYDGHLHTGVTAERTARAHAGYERLGALAAGLRRSGVESGELITSGSPTFPCGLSFSPSGYLAGVRHRVSPGTVVYHDLRLEGQCPELGLRPAAVVFSRVVSHPAPDLATCDAGSKSLAAEAGAPYAFVIGHGEYAPQEPNEEHLPLRVPPDKRPARGTELYLVPLHICPTVNLAERAVLVESGRVIDIVDVSARGHEMTL